MAASREKLVRNAEKFVSRGRIEAAIREYRKVLEDQPRDTGTLNRVGDLYARINRIDEAVRLFTQIAEQYTEEGFFVKAIAIYKKIIKLDPTRLGVYEKLAELYHRQGLVNEARTQYQVLADYYAKHENSTSAISIYQQMAKLEPEDPAHRVKLAELYQQGKLNDKAMEQYQLIADIMLEHGKVDQTVQVLRRGLEIDPQDLDYLAQAVDKLRSADQGAAARELLSAAKEHNPAAASLMGPVEEEAPPEDLLPPATVEKDFPAAVEVEAQPQEVPAPEPPEEDEGAAQFGAFDGGGLLEDIDDTEGPGALLAGDSSLQDALAEAEASVAGDSVDQDLTGQDDFLLDWDEEEADSLIKPPPDMVEMGPEVSGTGFRDSEAPELEAQAHEADLTGSWELDLASLDLESEEAVAAPEEVEFPEPAEAEEPAELEAVSAEGLFETLETIDAEEPGLEEPRVGEGGVPEMELDLDLDLVEGFSDVAPSEEPEAEALSSPEDLLSEAEVLAKYGLREKAFSRIQDVLDDSPDHLGALRVLIQLHLEDGDEAKVRELGERLRELSQESGETADWERVQESFAAAGFTLDKTVKKKPPKKPEKKPTTDRIDRLLASLIEDDSFSKSRGRAKKRDKALDDLLVEGLGVLEP
ncbi:MAG: tetratricopeptide repeat protein, partial [Acidobacteria bacterium]|nr:tetratricopeptide repeat protein [Acidobacteriota bacterium]